MPSPVVEFLRSFTRISDSRERWDSVFPISYGQFVKGFCVRLRSLKPGDDLKHTLSEG
jgi:hypothetical protein